ncbi:hypothetical protein V490_06015 [Pseudogymnoascus sp. VKM F-3557]|nr:hypothetical protein V490_06015 [Pseudogymnoascus sp. VKM F-3557]
MCKKFFQQLAETPFGHNLQWRLYLFKVGKATIAKHQARWSLDGQTVEYRGIELQMTQVSQLVLSEYQKAHSLLCDELLFGAKDLIPMESWRLKDYLDLEHFGGSWLSHPSNSEFLDGAELALFARRKYGLLVKKLACDRGVKKADFEDDNDDDDSERSVDAGGLTPRKRPKILPLNNAASEVASEQALLKALRAVLRDDHAQFRTPQQKEAVRLAAAKETPLVAILPTGGGKSLVFMVPAMLSGSGVTIVVAPYAELKRQLVTRCIDAGLDCKHWPEARESWPRVVLVSAEAASSDGFLQWAADVGVRGKLDRVVIDECHVTFTAATSTEGTFGGCHYYHGNPEDSNAHFLAQREAGFQAWLGGEMPYIVATAALGTEIDVPGITHVIHLEAPHSIIDYAQEAGCAGRSGERVVAVVVIEEKDWPEEDAAKDSSLELKRRECESTCVKQSSFTGRVARQTNAAIVRPSRRGYASMSSPLEQAAAAVGVIIAFTDTEPVALKSISLDSVENLKSDANDVTDLVTKFQISSLQEVGCGYLVESREAVAHLVDSLLDLPASPPSIYIDIKGVNLCRSGSISILQILVLPLDKTYLVDVHVLKDDAFTTAGEEGQTLKDVLESATIPKVFFDLMQLATRTYNRKYVNGLSKCIEKDITMTASEKRQWIEGKEKGKRLFAPELGGSYEVFNERPLPEEIAIYCTQDVRYMPKLWKHYFNRLSRSWAKKVEVATKDRITLSQTAGYDGKGSNRALGPW